MENTPIPENLDVSKTEEALTSFEERIDSLDKAFTKKTEIALQALQAFEEEFNDYLKGKGIKPLKSNAQIPEKYFNIAKKISDIGHKIAELRENEDFSVQYFEKTKLALPEDAKSAGFNLIDNNSIKCPAGIIEFLPEEGIITGLSWKEGELLVTTSKNLKFGIKLQDGNPIVRDIK